MTRGGDADLEQLYANQWYDQWVENEIPDLTGKVAIITGANSGTGFWAAVALAKKNCQVVIACRNASKAKHAKEEILEMYPRAQVDDSMTLDNMSFASVRQFAKEFHARYKRLDFLLNNAGVMATPLSHSKDGFESQIQTNHLSHFLLTKLLWDKLVATPGQARVVQHSSGAHILGYFNRSNVDSPGYNWGLFGWIKLLMTFVVPFMGIGDLGPMIRYGQSKLANMLFMKELARKIEAQNMEGKVISVACHPGSSSTNLQVQAHSYGTMPSSDKGMQSAADGSLPLLMATLGPKVRNGQYFGPARMMTGPPVQATIAGYGKNKALAQSLWEFSEESIKEEFAV